MPENKTLTDFHHISFNVRRVVCRVRKIVKVIYAVIAHLNQRNSHL